MRKFLELSFKINFKIFQFCFFSPKAPKRRRPARSIFDGFRDFQTETSRYLWTSLSSPSSLPIKKKKMIAVRPNYFKFSPYLKSEIMDPGCD